MGRRRERKREYQVGMRTIENSNVMGNFSASTKQNGKKRAMTNI